MTFISHDALLNARLDSVGLRVGKRVAIDDSLVADTWQSEYAELYVVDAGKLDIAGLQELLASVDGVVAKRLRHQRDQGRSIDAHVCIMVSSEMIDKGLVPESEASRFVSRKYWINRSSPVEEILQRLTLTWVDVTQLAPEGALPVSQEFTDLRERISKRHGAGAAADFIEALQ